MINLLVADDHEIFLDGLKKALLDVSHIVIKDIAMDGCQVIKLLRKNKYDILLLDVNMPKMNGVDCLKKIRKKGVDIKVIILSQYGDKKLVERLFKNKIEGYLLKNSSKDDIVRAIETVYEGKSYFSKEVESADLFYRKPSRFDYYQCDFSKREQQVLYLICEGLINSEIAAELKLSVHSVETFRQRIMVKAGMRNTAELVKWAVENNMIS